MDHCNRRKMATQLAKVLIGLDTLIVGTPTGDLRAYLHTHRIEIARLFTFTGYQFAADSNIHSARPRLEKRTTPHWMLALMDYLKVTYPSVFETLALEPYIPEAALLNHDSAWWRSEQCARKIDYLTTLLAQTTTWVLK